MGPKGSEVTGILGDTIRPGDGLATDATSSPEPPLSFTTNESHELLGKGDIVEGDWSHSTAGTHTGNLVTAELSGAAPPRDPEVSSAGLVVGSRGTAATATTSLEGPSRSGSSRPAAAAEEVSTTSG